MNEDSKKRIENLRFKKDSLSKLGASFHPADMKHFQEQLKCRNLASSTRIIPELFPEIGKMIEEVRRRIIPEYTVEAYVRNSSDAQACCFPGSGKSISIALTSGLIQLFSIEELCFVVGHELGHFLLEHHKYPQAEDAAGQAEKLNLLALSRSAEISADRVGFVATIKKESALKAVLKLATGLPDQFLRFDVSAYLDQARELHKMGGSEYDLLSTHPVCTTRMRALLWFEMSELYNEWRGIKGSAPISSSALDSRVEKDMSAASGFRLTAINKKEADSALLWGALSLFVADGRLSKDEQVLMTQTFGEKVSAAAFQVLKEHGPDKVLENFETALQSVKFMDSEIKETLYRDLDRFSGLAGGEPAVRDQLLKKAQTRLFLN